MPLINATAVTFKAMDVDLPGNRVLRVLLSLNAAGEPEDLCIASGFRPITIHALSQGVNVPASCLPALRDALASLGAA